MPYVARDASGSVTGLFANPQDFTREYVADADPAVVAFLSPKVTAVTPRQARLALLSVGLLSQVEAAVTAAGGATQITWEYATMFDRHDPLIISIGASLHLTSVQIDQLFQTASTL